MSLLVRDSLTYVSSAVRPPLPLADVESGTLQFATANPLKAVRTTYKLRCSYRGQTRLSICVFRHTFIIAFQLFSKLPKSADKIWCRAGLDVFCEGRPSTHRIVPATPPGTCFPLDHHGFAPISAIHARFYAGANKRLRCEGLLTTDSRCAQHSSFAEALRIHRLHMDVERPGGWGENLVDIPAVPRHESDPAGGSRSAALVHGVSSVDRCSAAAARGRRSRTWRHVWSNTSVAPYSRLEIGSAIPACARARANSTFRNSRPRRSTVQVNRTSAVLRRFLQPM